MRNGSTASQVSRWRMKSRPRLIALVGGSGAGKTWLSSRLQQVLGLPVTRLTLDDFYRDQSHIPSALRKLINFDHPRAIDWRLAEVALRRCREGRSVHVPRYSFVTHTRRRAFRILTPKGIVLVDGLWLLWRYRIRRLFDFSIFLHCPARLRLDRRLARDMANRGRDDRSVRRQFQKTVAPMHKRFVAPQMRWANMVIRQPLGREEVEHISLVIKEMVGPNMRKVLCAAMGSKR